jgi:hypothetical protein
MNALIAALCTVLACHVLEKGVLGTMRRTSNPATDMSLYKETIGALDHAAVESTDIELVSKMNVCRYLYAQVMNDGSIDQT